MMAEGITETGSRLVLASAQPGRCRVALCTYFERWTQLQNQQPSLPLGLRWSSVPLRDASTAAA
jgi:hypothetical protein